MGQHQRPHGRSPRRSTARRSSTPRSSDWPIPAVGAIAPAFGWAYLPPDQVDNPQAFNMEEARALAEEAGIIGAQPVMISSEEIGQRPTEVLRNILVDLGLDPQVDFQQAAAFNERWQSGDYDMFLHGSVVDADPDDGHWNIFYSEGPWNTYGYKSEEADQLLIATRETSDQEERARLFQELQTVLRARRRRRLRLSRQGSRRLQRGCHGLRSHSRAALLRASLARPVGRAIGYQSTTASRQSVRRPKPITDSR